MAARYNPEGTSKRDHIRRLLGDTDVSTALLQDEEIEAALAAYSYSVAVGFLADQILAFFIQEPDRMRDAAGGEHEFKSRTRHYERLSSRGASGRIPEPGVDTAAVERVSTSASTGVAWTRTS